MNEAFVLGLEWLLIISRLAVLNAHAILKHRMNGFQVPARSKYVDLPARS